MRRAMSRVGLLAVVACLLGGSAALGEVIALLDVRNQAGDESAAAVVAETLRQTLAESGDLVEPERTRVARRQLRLRRADEASSEALHQVATELGADWLLSATLHEVRRDVVPSLTVSLRAYEASSGELVWVGFDGASGLDRRGVLGLGVVEDLEPLVAPLVDRLVAGLSFEPRLSDALFDRVGPVALVPLLALTEQRATANAETVTEAVRAALFDLGIPLVSPNCTSDTLRRQGAVLWGGVDAETRRALHQECSARTLLTGSVEIYNVFVIAATPQPVVAMALRLIDASTGRVLWMADIERHGFDGVNLFGIGRVYSSGALTERLARRLLDGMRDEDGVWARRIQEMK